MLGRSIGSFKVYLRNSINRMQFGGTINEKKKSGRPTSWTPARKRQLKRLAGNRKGVSQRRLGRK